jgi:two-component system sensor histidine kinase EvgS
LLTLVNDILDLSKIEAGKLELEYGFVESQYFFTDFEKMFSFKTKEKNLEFTTVVSTEVPAFLNTDEIRLRQIIINLLGNAVKFTENGSVFLHIFCENFKTIVNSKGHDENVTDLIIEVKDTGIGIPEESIDEIFASFVQVKSKLSTTGTGLGLTITKKLVELMNGSIEVTSVLHKGSRFLVRIPNVSYLANQGKTIGQVSIVPSNLIFEKASLLVVDDVEINRKFLFDALKGTNIEVIEAANGQIALDIMVEITPDLVITDIRMPVMNGFELLGKMQADKKLSQIPVIAYSASVMKDQIERIYQSKFKGLLIKPVSMEELFLQLTKNLPYRMKESTEPHFGTQKSIDETVVSDPDKLIEKLEGEYLVQRNAFETRQPLQEVKDFALNIVHLGELHNSLLIKKYGNDLLSAANNFSVSEILSFLEKYTELSAQLKS